MLSTPSRTELGLFEQKFQKHQKLFPNIFQNRQRRGQKHDQKDDVDELLSDDFENPPDQKRGQRERDPPVSLFRKVTQKLTV